MDSPESRNKTLTAHNLIQVALTALDNKDDILMDRCREFVKTHADFWQDLDFGDIALADRLRLIELAEELGATGGWQKCLCKPLFSVTTEDFQILCEKLIDLKKRFSPDSVACRQLRIACNLHMYKQACLAENVDLKRFCGSQLVETLDLENVAEVALAAADGKDEALLGHCAAVINLEQLDMD